MTAAAPAFLAGYGFQVRLLCGSYPAPYAGFYADLPRAVASAWEAETPVRLLHEALKGRLTVHCVLDRGRLLDLWEWAKRTGLRHLDATVLEDAAFGDGAPRPGRLREIRNDLLAVCDEMADELAAQRLPVDFKPLTRIVDRLMRSEPLGQAYGERGSFASSFAGMMMPMADACPRSFFDSLDLRPLPDLPDGLEDDRGGTWRWRDLLPRVLGPARVRPQHLRDLPPGATTRGEPRRTAARSGGPRSRWRCASTTASPTWTPSRSASSSTNPSASRPRRSAAARTSDT